MIFAFISQPTTPNAQQAMSALLKAVPAAVPKVGYIASAPDPTREYFSQTQQLYRSLNAELESYLELGSDYCHEALQTLLSCDVIHLSGGDTQRFLQAVKRRNLINVLRSYVKNGGAIVGVSAGAMMLTPSIASAALCGDSLEPQSTAQQALNLIDFQFVPHFSSAQLTEPKFQQQLQTLAGPIYLCTDNDALVKVDEELFVYGNPLLIKN